jgi:hypothetical protein
MSGANFFTRKEYNSTVYGILIMKLISNANISLILSLEKQPASSKSLSILILYSRNYARNVFKVLTSTILPGTDL